MAPKANPNIQAWRNEFQAKRAEYEEFIPEHLFQKDLYDLIDGVDHILFPLVMGLYPFNAAHDPWRRGKTLADRSDKEALATEKIEYLTARKHLASAARNALTAWLAEDSNLQSWKANDHGPVYTAVAQTVRDMQATDLTALVAILRVALPSLIPLHRRAAWQKYVG